MARRTVDFLVRVNVDEDAMRLREDDDRTAWAEILGTLVIALETICHDNLGGDLRPVVVVTTGHSHTVYPEATERRAADGRTDNEQVD